MLVQVVLFEAAQRYWWSSEGFERFRAQEKFKLIEHLSRALENSDLNLTAKACLFAAGDLRAFNVCQPQMLGCDALAWLICHGGLEGQYELSTITLQDPRVKSVSQHVVKMWVASQTGPAQQ